MIYEIHSIGDPAFLSEVMKATSAIMSRGGVTNIVKIGFLLTCMWTVVQGILSGGSEIKIQNIVVAGIIYFAFFGLTVDRMEVWALDSPEMYQVEDVPLGLAFSGTMISKVGNKITEWFEQEYTVPEMSSSMFNTGYALKALYKMRGLGFADGSLNWDPDGHLTKTLFNYMNDCAIPGTTLPTKSGSVWEGPPAIDLKAALKSENAWPGLFWDNNVYTTKVYPFNDSPGTGGPAEVLTCAAAHAKIGTEWIGNTEVTNKWIEHIGISTCNEAGESCKAFVKIDGDFDTNRFKSQFTMMRDSILGSDVNLDRLLINRALSKAIGEVGSVRHLGDGDTLLSAVTSRASAQITANQALQQSMFEKMMRPLMTFFEALLFVSAPFAAILISFGVGGIQMIGKYLVFALWIQLWKPVAAVGNFFIQMSINGDMSIHGGFLDRHGGDLASIAEQPAMFDSMQHWIGVGGMLVASTPMITLMLMYGSAVTASSLASRIDMGKGSDVGMDGFSGKAQSGDKGASLTSETGATAWSNNQTADATQGSLSMGAAYGNESARQRTVAASETMKAETAQGKALSAISSASVKAASTQSFATDSGGQTVSSVDYAEQQARKLSQQEGLTNSEQSLASTGFNVKANAGVNMGGIKKLLGKAGVNTSGVKNMSHLGMIMESLSGEISTGADYQERFNEAANETRSLSDSVDSSWSKSESERESWSEGFKSSDADSITESSDYQEAEQHSETASQSRAKARTAESRASVAEKKSNSGAYNQQFQMATLAADVSNAESMGQFGQFLAAKESQGDSSYSGVPTTAAGFRGAVETAVKEGNVGDLKELLSMAGQDVNQNGDMGDPGQNLSGLISEHGSTPIHDQSPIVMGDQQKQAASDMSQGTKTGLNSTGGATPAQQESIKKQAGRELSGKELKQAGQAAALASSGGMGTQQEGNLREMLSQAGVSSSQATSGSQLALAMAGMGEKIEQGMDPQQAFDASLAESSEMADLGESVGEATLASSGTGGGGEVAGQVVAGAQAGSAAGKIDAAGKVGAQAGNGPVSKAQDGLMREMLNGAGVDASGATSGSQLAQAAAGMGKHMDKGMSAQKAFNTALAEGAEGTGGKPSGGGGTGGGNAKTGGKKSGGTSAGAAAAASAVGAQLSGGKVSSQQEGAMREMLADAGVDSSGAQSGEELAQAASGMAGGLAEGLSPQQSFDQSLASGGESGSGGGSGSGGTDESDTGPGVDFLSTPGMESAAETLGSEHVEPLSTEGQMDQARDDAFDSMPNVSPEAMTKDEAYQFGLDNGHFTEGDFDGVAKDSGDMDRQVEEAYENTDLNGTGGKAKDLFGFAKSGAAASLAESGSTGASVGAGVGAANAARNALMRNKIAKKAGMSALKSVVRSAIGGSVVGGPVGLIAGVAMGAYDAYNIYSEYQTGESINKASGELADGGVSNLSSDSKEIVGKTLEGVIGKQVSEMYEAGKRGEEFDHGAFMEGLSDFEKQVYNNADELMNEGYGEELAGNMEEALEKGADTAKDDHTRDMLQNRY